MALSIRNHKAERLAREVAEASGENLTQAIIRALEERLERLRGRRTKDNLAEEIMKISRRASSLPTLDQRPLEEILDYDRHGVPGK
jgi:antitoxin VapB